MKDGELPIFNPKKLLYSLNLSTVKVISLAKLGNFSASDAHSAVEALFKQSINVFCI